MGNEDAIDLPRAKVDGSAYDFSFSGLKSAVLNYLNGAQMKGEQIVQADVAASFQKAVVDVLVSHSRNAIDEFGFQDFALAGGVASNSGLRAAMEEMCKEKSVRFYVPPAILCTDNAAMIAAAGYYDYLAGRLSGSDLNARPALRLGDR